MKSENRIEQKEKPPVLYHGSTHKGLEELTPQRKSWRDEKEGPRIFATQELSLATIFMAPSAFSSGFFDDIPYAIIPYSREDFIAQDKGGHVYVLPSDTFISDPTVGLGTYEWTSSENVKPIKVIEYPSVLDAIIENGVQVYFVDESMRASIDNAPDHGLSILRGLESENMRRGVNVKVLPSHEEKSV
jgi:hypothetical protein